MVDVVAPQPGQTICDPACGTGGFLLAALVYLIKNFQLDRAQKKKLKSGTFFGIERVDSVTRLCTTSNKQLNFLQHIFTILKQHGRAAVVLPDNVLFEGGAGETIRRELLKQADIFWLKDEALEESANLPAPEIIAAEITADLEAALEQFATIADDLK